MRRLVGRRGLMFEGGTLMSWVRSKFTLLLVGMAMIAILVACGGGDDPTAPPAASTVAPATMAPSTAAPSTAAPAVDPTATPTLAPGVTPAATPTPTPTPRPTATPIVIDPGFDAEAYFSGKTIRIIVGFAPGGGYDAYSRLLGQALGRLMPGDPKVIVTNLPGGGGLRGLQETMRARPDGLTIHPMAPRHPAAEAAGTDLDDFDIETVNLIGTASFDDDHYTLCARRDVATSWQEVLDLGRDIITGTSAPGGDMIGGQFLEALGAPVHVVYGYEGTAEVLAAVDRDDLDATTRCDYQYITNLYPEWYDSRELVPLYWHRSPIAQDFLDRLGSGLQSEDIPHLFDLVDSTEDQQAALLLAQSLESMSRMFVTAPNVPEEIVQTWLKVFQDVVQDPEFIERAEIAERPVNYGDPAILLENLRKAKDFTPEARELFLSLYPPS